MSKISIIQTLIREFFDDETLVITEATKASDIDGWDSLANVQIILSIEETFKIHFSLEELTSFKCVGDIITIINSMER